MGRNRGTPTPVHPNEVLRYDFLEPFELSAHVRAKALRVPPNRITAILTGTRAATAETALDLARHFGTSPDFWLKLQKNYEQEVAEHAEGGLTRAEGAPRDQLRPSEDG